MKAEEARRLLMEVLIANRKGRRKIRKGKIDKEEVGREVLRLFGKPTPTEGSKTIWW